MKKFYIAAAALFSLALFAGEYWTPPRKKIIECGWAQSMGCERLRDGIEIYEKYTPADGVSIRLHGRDKNGKKFSTHYSFSPEPSAGRGIEVERWEYEYFKEDIAFLKATKFKKFTDNFFWMSSRDGNVDWFNDDHWNTICHNFSVVAKVAKETGMKGIFFDAEWYHNSKPVFESFAPGKTYRETAVKARQRGREWASAMFKEYPEMKLFLIFGFAWEESYRNTPELATLKVAFFNGVYDVLPPTATVIEGHEHHGYGAIYEADFPFMRTDVHGEVFQKMVAPENIAKYRAQTQFAPAIWTDLYLSPELGDSSFLRRMQPFFDKTPRMTIMRRNIVRSLAMADEYVWCWSQYGRWFPHKSIHPGSKFFYEKENPGAADTVRSAIDPLGYAKGRLAQVRYDNMIQDPAMSAEFIRPNRPKFYDFWIAGKKGTCVKAPQAGCNGKDALLIQGSENLFTLSQTFNVKNDQLYYVRARIKKVENKSGEYALLVSYAYDKKRASCNRDTQTVRFGEPGADGWQVAEMAVIVPENMTVMNVRVCGKWMHDNDRILVDLMEVYKIDDGHAVPVAKK